MILLSGASLFTIFLPLIIALEVASRKIYRVNLDLNPRVRWNHVIDEHKHLIPEILQEIKGPIFWLSENLINHLPVEYAEELRGIADRLAGSGLSLGEIVTLNLLYDLTDFKHSPFTDLNNTEDRFWSTSSLGCTSIVAINKKRQVFHGRNLDYGMPEVLKKAAIYVDFVKNGTVMYSALSFVTCVGIITGQKPHAFTVSLNARYSGGPFENVLMELLTRFHHPIQLEIRQTLEKANNYSQALQYLNSVHFVAPSYIILGGIDTGSIITRNRWAAADVFPLDTEKGLWFLVETNDDHWRPSSDTRRKLGNRWMRAIGRSRLTPATLFHRVLSRYPILNRETIFSAIMSAADPSLILRYTKIWNFGGNSTTDLV